MGFDPPSSSHSKPSVRLRNKPPGGGGGRPRPKTMAGSSVPDVSNEMMYPSHVKKGSTHNIAGGKLLSMYDGCGEVCVCVRQQHNTGLAG